jgi:predicted RNA-binding Zn-ribbon protein involved in translation (DUF1610 family)
MDCPKCGSRMSDKGEDKITKGTIYECPQCGYECILR